jgi:2-phosphosulfolactate phosphatase
MRSIVRLPGFEAASNASGTTVVIDTFRAFATAAHLFDAGVERMLLADTVEEARAIAAGLDDALLVGEDDGRRPQGFDIGNSPTEVLARDDLSGRTVVLRTSAGTRGVATAVGAGAGPVYAASLLVASSTASAIADADPITLVSSGGTAEIPHDEDEITGDLIAALVRATPVDIPSVLDRIRTGTGALRLGAAVWIPDDDIERCLEVDRFDFAMEAVPRDGVIELDPRGD